MSKRFIALFVFTLILVNIFIYWPQPNLGYVLDDHYVVAQNPVVKKPSFDGLLTSGFFDATNRSVDSKLLYYRPVVLASLALDYQLWGSSPAAFRWVNVVIHIVTGLLVAVLFYLLFGNAGWSMAGAILFSILPIHEWSVRYISGRGDLLSAFYGMISLVLLVRYFKNDDRVLLWTSLVCFCLAVLSKESALLNVALTGLVAWVVTKDFRRVLEVSSVFLLAAGSYYVLRQVHAPMGVAEAVRMDDVVKGLALSGEYAQRFLMPWSLRSWIGPVLGGLIVYGTIAVLIGATVMRSSGDRQRRALFFGLAWILICSASFIVTQRIIGRLGPVLSEHFLYLEAVGFALLIVVLVGRMPRADMRVLSFTGLSFYFILLSLTGARFWTSEESLLRYVNRLEGRKAGVAYEQLIMRYDSDPSVVLRMIVQAKSGDTQSVWYRRLGEIYRSQKNYPQAKVALARAADLNPRNIEALNALAVCHLETGGIAQGVKLLNGSILISPQQSDAFRLMGILLYRQGHFAQAIPFLQKAWGRDPDLNEAALHLMMAYFFIDDQPSYLKTAERVLAQFNDSKVLLSFTATQLYSHGYFQQALKVIDQSQDLHSDPAMMVLAQSARQRISNLPK